MFMVLAKLKAREERMNDIKAVAIKLGKMVGYVALLAVATWAFCHYVLGV